MRNFQKLKLSYFQQLKRPLSHLSHINHDGTLPQMVDISMKSSGLRKAHAQATIKLPTDMTGLELKVNMKEIDGPKGPVFSTAIICGVLGSKRTSELIPFCHNIPIESCDISIDILNSESVGVYGIVVNCKVSTSSKTGVEMEAMMGASLASLCIYDMLKAASHHIQITNIKLVSKSGGKSCFIST